MTVRGALALSLAMVLAACQLTGGFPYGGTDPNAPAGPGKGEAIDGLTVGHRLMEAGEYDLALQAYYRAAAEKGATVDVISAIGSADYRLGRLGQAETMLRRAIAIDGKFVPAWNNLGVVLMDKGQVAEASRVFQTAYALDSGESDDIRENLKRALAKLEKPDYDPPQAHNYKLVRRGYGEYLLLGAPEAEQ